MHHAIRVFVRIGIKENTVDNAENDGGRSNSKSQRKDRGGNKSGRLAKKAHRVANILQDGFHEPSPSNVLVGLDGGRSLLVSRTKMDRADARKVRGSPVMRVAGIHLRKIGEGERSAAGSIRWGCCKPIIPTSGDVS